ncbi:hypothetical protein A11A3_13325 [Alcanivorax hongdengensis A-11-3]|uniref:Lipoprotein n=1 Tax=Alcanivorax hongdengensis A-11-3 TaxID=1177179 RepID=L0W9A5_9GAMM|nr:hypothetical protein [Alcanivorax hongdengensis]EKF73521.1 hypothetical protein A11A3_13325 [Alcanivorax hongdengensis A-11-3]
MKPAISLTVIIVMSILTGCDKAARSSPQESSTGKVFDSEEYGVSLAYDTDQAHLTDPGNGYFGTAGWRLDRPDDKGQTLLTLRLTGSDEIRAGELHLGVSRAPQALAACTRPGDNVRPASIDSTSLANIAFTTFDGGDAAMNHYQHFRAWRAVHNGTCYAIDLVVQGSNPQVYDPPRQPPFSQDDAWQRLTALLQGLTLAP